MHVKAEILCRNLRHKSITGYKHLIDRTNAIESLIRVICKTIKAYGSFPTDNAATKLIYLAIRVDNGPEYISGTLQNWAEKAGIALMYIQHSNPQ